MGNLDASERERFAARIRIESEGGCHFWTGPLDRDGYGAFYLRRKNRRAHRVAWYEVHGEIPEGMVVNHICKTRNCVNVQHLQIVTPRENTLHDSVTVSAINARKTHCPRGHEYDRIYSTRRGGKSRYCSICDQAKRKRLRAKWHAEDTLRV
jgi:hypothetical protein